MMVPFRFGLQEGEDPKALPPGTLTQALNCRIDKAGRLRKRRGTSGLAKTISQGGGTLAAGVRLVPRGKATGLFDGKNLYEYSDGLAAWSLIDRAPNMDVSWSPLMSATTDVIDATVGIYGNYLVLVYGAGYQADYPLWVEVRDLSTGAIVLRPTALNGSTGGRFPRVLFRGSGIAVLTYASSTNLYVNEIDLSTMTLTAKTLLGSTTSGGVFDAAIAGANLYVVHELGGNLTLSYWPTSTYSGGINRTVAAGTMQSAALDVTVGESAYVIYTTSTTTAIAVHDPANGFQVVTPVTLVGNRSAHVAVKRVDSTHCVVAFDSIFTVVTEIVSSAGVIDTTTTRTTLYTSILSNFFTGPDGRAYIGASTVTLASGAVAPAPSHLILDVDTSSNGGVSNVPHRLVGVYEPRFANFNSPNPNITSRAFVTQVAVDSGGNNYLAAPYRLAPSVGTFEVLPTAYDLIRIATVDAESDAWRSVEAGGITLTAGGVPCVLDGYTAITCNYVCEPFVTLVGSTTGGTMLAGTYFYKACYEYIDANGLLHRSAFSSPRSVTTTGSTSSVSVTVRSTALSGKQSLLTGLGALGPGRVRIAIYRTLAGGSDYYRLTHEPDLNVLYNSPSSTTDPVLVDTLSDSAFFSTSITLAQRPQPYTVQETDDVSPPSCITAASHKGRFALLSGDSKTLWISKSALENPLVFPGFNEAFTIEFALPKVALCSMDDVLVALGPDSIELVEGEGSPANGVPFGWHVRLVQTDVGCTNARSVVRGPMGVFFLSRRGMELLDRGLSVTWIGRSVQDEIAAYPNITSAVLVAEAHEIRWTCNAADGLSGIVLVFDYANNAWLTRTYCDASDTAAQSVPFTDAALIANVYTLLTAGGQVYRESSAHSLDAGTTWVTLDVTLSWLAPGGNIGWHRARQFNLLGTAVSDHDLTIQIGRDFLTTWDQTEVFLSGSDVCAPGPLETVRIQHAVQKVQAVRYRITDGTPSGGGSVGTGEGPILEGIGLIVGVKEGFPRRSATKQAG